MTKTQILHGYLNGLPSEQRRLVDQFHELYYGARQSNMTWGNTQWMGVRTLKCPLDLWLYQEIIFAQRPDLIVETGTAMGGSALYLSNMCDLIGHGEVITIDVKANASWPQHQRLTYLVGSSIAKETAEYLRGRLEGRERVLVILDSDHTRDHVRQELELFAPLVQPGGYLIVEDTIVNGHPVRADFGPGPMEAVVEFLAIHPEFEIDRSQEKFLLSFNRNGYLKRAA